MMEVIELSTGHVFAPKSVTCIGPVRRCDRDGQGPGTSRLGFVVVGVGFEVPIEVVFSDFDDGSDDDAAYDSCWKSFEAAAVGIRQEAVDKLLSGLNSLGA